jgi:hypothetical protein
LAAVVQAEFAKEAQLQRRQHACLPHLRVKEFPAATVLAWSVLGEE